MPRGDGTGPLGEGPMTGRGFGNCAGAGVGRAALPARGGGPVAWGYGFGRGRGRRNWFHATGLTARQRGAARPPWTQTPSGPVMGAEDDTEALRSLVAQHERALEEITARIEEVEARRG